MARTPAAEYGESIQKHAEWAMDILARHPELNAENVHSIVQDEVGHVFEQVLVGRRRLQDGRRQAAQALSDS